MQEVTSKNMDGITDLVVVAPIKEGFIEAYENVTYATRLKLVAEALNRIRVAAREYERILPYSDVTERILNILDFRIGVLDKDVFGLTNAKPRPEGKGHGKQLESRRFLYLTATFEGGFEPYMRLIWRPLGSFLDLVFCNCEGYVTATEHSCEEYLQWVRDNQMDSAIFYAVTGLSTRDGRYLPRLERLAREGANDLALTKYTMPYPEPEAEKTRDGHLFKSAEMGIEALNVLYSLANFYPPEWMAANGLSEGHRLIRATAEILRGWDQVVAEMAKVESEPYKTIWSEAQVIFKEPLEWFKTGREHLAAIEQAAKQAEPKDPQFLASEIQGGIIKSQGTPDDPVRHGALLLFTIRDAEAGREFLQGLDPHFAEGPGDTASNGIYRTFGLTPTGLLRLGLDPCVVELFPKEFREGMATRSGLLGDMRENHPRNWRLPVRNGPALTNPALAGQKLPPVELDEVDLVVQVRSTNDDPAALLAEIAQLAGLGGSQVTLEAYELLRSGYDPATGLFRDHFRFLDGLSQPVPQFAATETVPKRDRVKTGELFVGYGNDRGDAAPAPFETLEGKDGNGDPTAAAWRARHRKVAQQLQVNGTYLVVRKIGEEVSAFDEWLDKEAAAIHARDNEERDGVRVKPDSERLGWSVEEARARLKAAVMGRDDAGKPLVPTKSPDLNDFDYGEDADGAKCPFFAHVRRANPRRTEDASSAHPENTWREHGRPTPRILRRGMLFGDDKGSPRGLMFMAYNASIAEQYEVIQRWLNGGNSTDASSWNNDVLTGVRPRNTDGSLSGSGFRMVASSLTGEQVVLHVKLPDIARLPTGDLGSHPFTPLHWGLYLFVPSRTAIERLVSLKGRFKPMRDPLEDRVGQEWIDRLATLPAAEAAREWKRLLEDFVAKDPTQSDISPNLWAALRYQYGGVLSLRELENSPDTDPVPHNWVEPDEDSQNMVICAGRAQVREVLHDWRRFSSEEALNRMEKTSGPLFVAQQPDDRYFNRRLTERGLNYRDESIATNKIIWSFDEAWGFETGYRAAEKVLLKAKSTKGPTLRRQFKLELRRQFLYPALAQLFADWYGIPDGVHFKPGGWSWKRIVAELSEADPETEARTDVLCPGDFLSTSRATFYPRPSPTVRWLGSSHGKAILRQSEAFVKAHRDAGTKPNAAMSGPMFDAIPPDKDDVLARNIIGTMVGGIPPMEANLRGVLVDWLAEKSLWRHQAALKRVFGSARSATNVKKAMEVLRGPVTEAICKRPAPDLVYRTAKCYTEIEVHDWSKREFNRKNVAVKKGDLIVVSQVAAAQRSLINPSPELPHGDPSIVFGGRRRSADQKNDTNNAYPSHACPAQRCAMGAMQGMLAALLDAGTIQALPASLIVRISDWQDTPAPAS